MKEKTTLEAHKRTVVEIRFISNGFESPKKGFNLVGTASLLSVLVRATL